MAVVPVFFSITLGHYEDEMTSYIYACLTKYKMQYKLDWMYTMKYDV